MRNNRYVNEIVNAIRKASKDLNIEPREITRNQLVNEDYVSDWSFRRAGGLDAIKDAYFPLKGKDLAGIHKTKARKNYISKLEANIGSRDVVIDQITDAVKGLKLPKLKEFKPKSKQKISRAVNAILSDLHIGSDIKKAETGQLDFGRVEEARRLAKITEEIVNYKPQYRAETELNLFLLGDNIQNQLHDPRDGAPGAEQIARCTYLLYQSIAHLSQNYPQVNIYCSSGNHGRLTSRHKTRAVNQKWDSIETTIYYSLKLIFDKQKNVKFNIPLTPFVVANVLGKKMFATHGDTVLKPGYPNKAIKVGSLEEQINKINATLPDTQEYSVFMVGHVHVGSITHLANGSVMITNGCMVPSDEFAVSIGLLENTCGQYIFESVPGYPVGDCRFIKITNEDDKNSKLDNIIKPFEGL